MVSVGDVIHKVRLRLHSKEERKEEERIEKGRSKDELFCGTVVNHGFWRRSGGGTLMNWLRRSSRPRWTSASPRLRVVYSGYVKIVERTFRSAEEKRESCPDIPWQ